MTQASVVNGVIHRKPAGGAPGGHELSDAELLALANLAPVRVEGSSDKRIEDVLIAANNGLIDIVTPSEFEHQLRFRVERLGSTEFANSWTNDERFSSPKLVLGTRGPLAAKWVSFIERGYMAYLADKAAQWRSATRRMHTAAVIGNVIGQVTVTAATLFIGGGGAGAARGGGEPRSHARPPRRSSNGKWKLLPATAPPSSPTRRSGWRPRSCPRRTPTRTSVARTRHLRDTVGPQSGRERPHL